MSMNTISADPVAFPVLTAEEIAAALACGLDERFAESARIFEAGDRPQFCFIVVEGEIGIFDTSGESERVIATHGRGHFTGELSMLVGRPAIAACRALTECRLVRLSAENVPSTDR